MENFPIIITTLFLLSLLVISLLYYLLSREKSANIKVRNELFMNSQNIIIIWSTDFKILKANDTAKRLLNKFDTELSPDFIAELFGFDSAKNTTSTGLAMRALSGVTDKTLGNEIFGQILISWKSAVIGRRRGTNIILTQGTDVTYVHKAERSLAELQQKTEIQERHIDVALESADIGLVYIYPDTNGNFIELSKNIRSTLGIREGKELTLRDLSGLVHQTDLYEFTEKMNSILNGMTDHITIGLKIRTTENPINNMILKCTSTRDDNDNVIVISGALIDIERQKEKFNLFDRSTYEDMATGLLNTRGFFDRSKAFINNNKNSGKIIAMVSIKIRNMLKTTSLFGVDTWDKLLKTYAEGLLATTTEKALIARNNTDDFILLSLFTDEEEIEREATKFNIFLETSCNDDKLPTDIKPYVSFDAGVCVFDGEDDAETMFNKANIMQYAGKNLGQKLCHFYSPNVEKKIFEHELMGHEIVNAIKNDEFVLYYQPKVSFRTGEILGAEALIRWNHPTRGLLQPYEFIPVAEEIGVITRIDEFVLFEACKQLRRWQIQGFRPIHISINMTQIQFYKTDVVNSIKTALHESNLDPKYLEIELTETVAVFDMPKAIALLKEIKALGVVISMDDFGTGYSSLASLKFLPIDILKIDRSLVYDIDVNATSQKMVTAVVEMGKAMGLRVVAEGVETQNQLDILHALGCDEAQGYFYGRPISVAKMEKTYFIR